MFYERCARLLDFEKVRLVAEVEAPGPGAPLALTMAVQALRLAPLGTLLAGCIELRLDSIRLVGPF